MNRRLVARLRTHYPPLLPLVGVVFGQLIALIITPHSVTCTLVVGVLLCVLLLLQKGKTLGDLCAYGVGGIASILLTLPNLTPTNFYPFESFLMEVDDAPRFRKVGGVELSLEVKSILRSDGETLLHIPDSAREGMRFLCKGKDLPWRNSYMVRKGDRLVVKGSFVPIHPTANPFQWDSSLWRRGYSGTCKILYTTPPLKRGKSDRGMLREYLTSLVSSHSEEEEGLLLLSMAFGFRDAVTDQTERVFRESGLSHLLVLSGYQISLVYGFTALLARILLIPIWRRCPIFSLRGGAAIIGIAFASIFVHLTGCESSSVRALVASALVTLSLIFERGRGILHLILSSALILSLLWPGSLLDPSLQLGFGALIGIALGVSSGSPTGILVYLSVALHVWFATSFIQLLWFGDIAPLGIILNPILVPLVSVLSAHGGIFALTLLALGIDPHGYLLSLLLFLTGLFLDVVVWCAENVIGAVSLEGIPRMITILGIGSVLGIQVVRRVRSYRTMQNL